MNPAFIESRRHLFYILFFLFESLFLAAVTVGFCVDPRKSPGIGEAAGLTFWFAFIGLFTISLILRRACRRLAVIGWISLFIGFWSMAMLPIV
jgi:hypothetical protein